MTILFLISAIALDYYGYNIKIADGVHEIFKINVGPNSIIVYAILLGLLLDVMNHLRRI